MNTITKRKIALENCGFKHADVRRIDKPHHHISVDIFKKRLSENHYYSLVVCNLNNVMTLTTLYDNSGRSELHFQGAQVEDKKELKILLKCFTG